MVPLRYATKLDPFLSLDCAPTPSTLAQSKERKGSNFAAQRSGAIVLQDRRAKHIQSKDPAIAIWQPRLPHLTQLHPVNVQPGRRVGRVGCLARGGNLAGVVGDPGLREGNQRSGRGNILIL